MRDEWHERLRVDGLHDEQAEEEEGEEVGDDDDEGSHSRCSA